jgi:hypothetical protein
MQSDRNLLPHWWFINKLPDYIPEYCNLHNHDHEKLIIINIIIIIIHLLLLLLKCVI